MRYAIAAGAFALFTLATAEATVTVTEISTVVPADCVASECDPELYASASSPNALSILDSASTYSYPSTTNALSVLLSALTVETPTSYPASAFPSFPTSGSVSTESSQTQSTGQTGIVPSPSSYGETTTTIQSTATVESTATAQVTDSSVASPEATSDSAVPTTSGPVTSGEGTPVPTTTASSNEAGPESTTLATEVSSTTDSTTTSGPQSTNNADANQPSTTEAPPVQQTGAAKTNKPAVAGLAAIMAALVYV
ncbi:hypothetical protein Slin15195_G008070 [Septoria linicola]|uniref:Uncharacterized protein n=1 Tax=Septoria linicola TaxID=215465 RepID=A0A9Q9AJV6_9PEZI|nr:hypothetical protein Slin14017_G008080 [Septoria linicola]USW47488.1 hypothetical protein Slin15195_G008070 [Septoria linicola]